MHFLNLFKIQCTYNIKKNSRIKLIKKNSSILVKTNYKHDGSANTELMTCKMLQSRSKCETKSLHLHLISFTTSMWFECVTKVPLTWKSKTIEGIFRRQCCPHVWTWGSCLSRKASSYPLQLARRLRTRTWTYLDDPVSSLDAGSHSSSIYDTKDKV